jgi:hypothetical protein
MEIGTEVIIIGFPCDITEAGLRSEWIYGALGVVVGTAYQKLLIHITDTLSYRESEVWYPKSSIIKFEMNN